MAICPECKSDIGNSLVCLCGWTKSKPKRFREEDGIDHSKICAYTFRGEKCQRLATISQGVRGEGPWYCRDHYWGREPSSKPIQKDWRDELIDSKITSDLYRQPGESKSAYNERMLAKVKETIGNMTKLPYDKNKKLSEDDEERLAIQEYSNTPF